MIDPICSAPPRSTRSAPPRAAPPRSALPFFFVFLLASHWPAPLLSPPPRPAPPRPDRSDVFRPDPPRPDLPRHQRPPYRRHLRLPLPLAPPPRPPRQGARNPPSHPPPPISNTTPQLTFLRLSCCCPLAQGVRSGGVQKPENLSEEALEGLRLVSASPVETDKPPSPVQALLGGIAAGVIALILYKFTTTVEAALNRQTISDNFSVNFSVMILGPVQSPYEEYKMDAPTNEALLDEEELPGW